MPRPAGISSLSACWRLSSPSACFADDLIADADLIKLGITLLSDEPIL